MREITPFGTAQNSPYTPEENKKGSKKGENQTKTKKSKND